MRCTVTLCSVTVPALDTLMNSAAAVSTLTGSATSRTCTSNSVMLLSISHDDDALVGSSSTAIVAAESMRSPLSACESASTHDVTLTTSRAVASPVRIDTTLVNAFDTCSNRMPRIVTIIVLLALVLPAAAAGGDGGDGCSIDNMGARVPLVTTLPSSAIGSGDTRLQSHTTPSLLSPPVFGAPSSMSTSPAH